jgi:hypothetical protein
MRRRYRKPQLTKSRVRLGSVYCAVAMLTTMGIGYGVDDFYSAKDSTQAALLVTNDFIPTAKTLPATRAKAAAKIAATSAGWQIRSAPYAQALDYLKHHYQETTIIVTASDPNHTVALARAKGAQSGIVRLDLKNAEVSGVSAEMKTVWTGSYDWQVTEALLGFEGGVLLLLLTGLGSVDTLNNRRAAAREREEEAQRLANWRRYIPNDGLFGPAEPVQGFTIYVPEWQEHPRQAAARATFSATRYSWGRTDWCKGQSEWEVWEAARKEREEELAKRPRLTAVRDKRALNRYRDWQAPAPLAPRPASVLATQQLPQDADVSEVSERWFEYCRGVADHNARVFARSERERQLAEDTKRTAQLEAELAAEEAQRLELERGNLADLLVPGHQLMQGLSSE